MWHLCLAIIAPQPCTAWQLLRVAQTMHPPKVLKFYWFAGLNCQGATGAINLDLGDHRKHLFRCAAQCDCPLPGYSQFNTVAKAMC